jgi:hypothetical protein
MATATCIAWILWATLPSGAMVPLDGYDSVSECKAQAISSRESAVKKGDLGRSYQCFPHTFNPQPNTAK